MCFVHSHTLRLLWPRVLEDILFRLGRVPKSCVVDGGYREVLSDILDPCGYPLDSFA